MPVASTPDPFDDELSELIARGAFDEATERTIRRFGPELIGWLCSILQEDGDAHEAFSRMSEDLWKSLPAFEGRCSMRTWCYMLARHAAARVRAEPRRQHEILVSHVPSIAHAVTQLWNTTRAQAQHEQNVYVEIRNLLAEDDQMLLVLRVDKDLSWRDIALVLLGERATADELTRKAAALRKQFERVKAQLRALAGRRIPP